MKKTNTIQHVPYRASKLKQLQEFARGIDPEFDRLYEILCQGLMRKFPVYADAEGIKAWESWLQIYPKASESLEDRRFAVIAKLNEKLPYTWVRLHEIMDALVGEGNYDIDLKGYKIWVTVDTDYSNRMQSVKDMLLRVLPMNLLLFLVQRVRKQVRDIDVAAYEIIKRTFRTRANPKPQYIYVAPGFWTKRETRTRANPKPQYMRIAPGFWTKRETRTRANPKPSRTLIATMTWIKRNIFCPALLDT